MADVLGSPAQPPGSASEPRLLGGALDAGGRLLGGLASAPGRILGGIGSYFTSPIPGGDPSLSGGQNAALRIADVLSRLGPPGPQSAGANSPLLRHVALQQQQAQQRRQDFMQNLSVLAKMGDFLDSTPLQGREDRLKELRERYGQEFGGPGSEVLFDAVFGDPGSAQGVLAELAQDPEIQQRIAQGASAEEIQALRQSPEFQARAQERQDKQLLPAVEEKVQGLLASPSPVLRQALERAQRDGKITVEEIRKLNEIAGQGPEGFSLTPSELGTLERRQADLASRIDGFETTEEAAAERKATQDFEKFRREEELRQRGRVALEELRKRGKSSGTPTETSQLTFARDVQKRRAVYDETASQIRRAVDSPLNGVGDIQSLYQFIARQDNTAAREGELDLAQRAASALGRLERITGNITDGRLLDDTQREQMRTVLQQMLMDTEQLRDDFLRHNAEVARSFNIDPGKIVPDFNENASPAPEGSTKNAPERRRARTRDGREVTVELGEDGKWHEVTP